MTTIFRPLAALGFCLMLSTGLLSPVVAVGGDAHATALASSVWQVESIDRGGIVDRSLVTMDFSEAGRVSGSSGCNRYFGSVRAEGESISFGAMGSSLRACIDALMTQERRFFLALEAAAHFAVDEDQWLVISDADGQERLRAIRLTAESSTPPAASSGLSPTTTHTFTCENFGTVSFRFRGPETMALTVPGDAETLLTLQPTASGTRYANAMTEFWNKGDEAMLTNDGHTYSCKKKGS